MHLQTQKAKLTTSESHNVQNNASSPAASCSVMLSCFRQSSCTHIAQNIFPGFQQEDLVTGDAPSMLFLNVSNEPLLLELAAAMELFEADDREERPPKLHSSNFCGRSSADKPCFVAVPFLSLESNLDMMPGSAGLIAVHRT